MTHVPTTLVVSAVMALLVAAPTDAVGSTGTNLVQNGSFEGTLAGWTVTPAGGVKVVTYGSIDAPSSAVSLKIGGGASLVQANASSGATIQQIVALPPLAPSCNLHFGGYLGGIGKDPDNARVVLQFLTATNVAVGAAIELAPVTPTNRNFESVLMLREGLSAIPPTATKVSLRIEFSSSSCCDYLSTADGIFVEAVETPLVPAPVGVGVELLHNPSFDAGWVSSSPLDLTDPQGWEGTGENDLMVRQYAETDPLAPPPAVSAIIGGGPQLISFGQVSTGSYSTASLLQRIDLRGNQLSPTGFAGLRLRASAHLGGVDDSIHTAELTVTLRSIDGIVLFTKTLGPVDRVMRNFETVVLKRASKDMVIPAETAFADVELVLRNYQCCDRDALADKLSVKLVPEVPPEFIKLNKNLLSNGSFQSNKALPGSPLELDNPTGWSGNSEDVALAVVDYGEDADVPSASFGNQNGLGPRLVRPAYFASSGEYCSLVQSIDLTDSKVLIDSGHLEATVSAWLGAAPFSTDSAEVRILLLNESGNLTALMKTLGPVTGENLLGSVKLKKKKKNFEIPPFTRTLKIDLRLTNNSGCCDLDAFADSISVVFDSDIDPDELGPEACDRAKVIAVGKYMRRTLKAYAKHVGKDPSKQDPQALEAALDKAAKKLTKAFSKAESKALDIGASCTYTGTAQEVIDTAQEAREFLVGGVTAGMNPLDADDRDLRKTILVLAGDFYRDANKAEGENILEPNDEKLSALREKYRAKFMKKVDKAIAATLTLYTGADAAGLAALIDADIDAAVELLH